VENCFAFPGYGVTAQCKYIKLQSTHDWQQQPEWVFGQVSKRKRNQCEVGDLFGLSRVVFPNNHPGTKLGQFTLASCESTEEFQYLKNTAMEWKAKMEWAHLMHNDTFFSLRSSILCKLVYPLAVTNFSKQQCLKIMKPILQVGLPNWVHVHNSKGNCSCSSQASGS